MSAYDRDHELAAALREVADDVQVPDGEAMEQRLLATFAEERRHRSSLVVGRSSLVVGRSSRLRQWLPLAAAAVLVLAAAVTWYPVPQRPPAPKPPSTPKNSESLTTSPSTPKNSESLRTNPSTPTTRAMGRRAASARAAANDVEGEFEDFVALPGASALPDFESGRIVRVEMPLTALPAYGLDMVLDATPNAVEADLLVGQDGVPRAIRLAGMAFNNRSR